MASKGNAHPLLRSSGSFRASFRSEGGDSTDGEGTGSTKKLERRASMLARLQRGSSFQAAGRSSVSRTSMGDEIAAALRGTSEGQDEPVAPGAGDAIAVDEGLDAQKKSLKRYMARQFAKLHGRYPFTVLFCVSFVAVLFTISPFITREPWDGAGLDYTTQKYRVRTVLESNREVAYQNAISYVYQNPASFQLSSASQAVSRMRHIANEMSDTRVRVQVRVDGSVGPQKQEVGYPRQGVEVFFFAADGDIFSSTTLNRIREVETAIINQGYSSVCQMQYDDEFPATLPTNPECRYISLVKLIDYLTRPCTSNQTISPPGFANYFAWFNQTECGRSRDDVLQFLANHVALPASSQANWTDATLERYAYASAIFDVSFTAQDRNRTCTSPTNCTCDTGYYSHATCDKFCDFTLTCLRNGICNNRGDCVCGSTFFGEQCLKYCTTSKSFICDSSRNRACSTSGDCICAPAVVTQTSSTPHYIEVNGSCVAQTGSFAAASCCSNNGTLLRNDTAGNVETSSSLTCSGLNSTNFPSSQAFCRCNPYYFGTQCEKRCEGATTCNGRGECNANGDCQCYQHHYGPTCLQYCLPETSCNGHGTCHQSTGACVCQSGYYGVSCNITATGTLRSFFPLGTPVDGYTSVGPTEFLSKQLAASDNFVRAAKGVAEGAGYRVYEPRTYMEDVRSGYKNDVLFSIGTWSFVFVFAWLHTSSLFLTLSMMVQIAFGMFSAFFFLRIGMDIEWIGVQYYMNVFIIQFIALSDMYLLVDAWVTSEHEAGADATDMEKRLEWMFRRGIYTVFLSSTVALSALFCLNLAPEDTVAVAPLRLQGLFLGFLIFFHLLYSCIFLPSCFVVYERYFRYMFEVKTPKLFGQIGQLILRKARDKVFATVAQGVSWDKRHKAFSERERKKELQLVAGAKYGKHKKRLQVAIKKPKSWQRDISSAERAWLKDMGLQVTFHYEVMSVWIRKHRSNILVTTLVLMSVAIVFSLSFNEATYRTRDFRLESGYTHLQKNSASFRVSRNSWQNVEVNFVWGVVPIDTGNPDDPTDLGILKWDLDFNITDPRTQESIMRVCEQFPREMGNIVVPGSRKCFLRDFRNWLVQKYNNANVFPLAGEQFNTEMILFLRSANGSSFENRGVYLAASGQARVASVSFLANLPADSDASQNQQVYSQFESFVDAENARARAVNASTGTLFQTSKTWVWMKTQNDFNRWVFLVGAVATVVGMAVAFAITLNLVISAYAAIAVLGLLSFLTCLMKWSGWEMHAFEASAILSALAVSYNFFLHLLVPYANAPGTEKFEKTRYAIGMSGHSMVTVSMSIFIAAMFLWGSEMQMFYTTVVTWLIVSSFALYFGLVALPAFLMSFGPENEKGDIPALIRYIQFVNSEDTLVS